MAYEISSIYEVKKDEDVYESSEVNQEDNIDSDLIDNMVNYYYFMKFSEYLNNNIHNLKSSPYIIFILSIFFEYFNIIIDKYIEIKLYGTGKYNIIKDYLFSNNYVHGIYLINKDNFINIENEDINTINKNYFYNIFKKYNVTLDINSCILVKYFYKDKNYRLYVNYKNIEEKVIELPLNIENITKKYQEKYNKNILVFFKSECNEIESAKLNDIDIKDIIEECNGIFNDFGLLDNNKIYIYYLTNELNITNLDNLEIKYKNFHLDEEKMELVDHKIDIKDNNYYLTSDIINKILNN